MVDIALRCLRGHDGDPNPAKLDVLHVTASRVIDGHESVPSPAVTYPIYFFRVRPV